MPSKSCDFGIISHFHCCVIMIRYLLYKDEKLSVCLSVLATLITLPSRNISTPDLLKMKAMSSGIYKLVLKSF